MAEAAKVQNSTADFASNGYRQCFGNLTPPDENAIRESTLKYCDSFVPQLWYDEPICTLLNGKQLREGKVAETTNPWGKVNGKITFATDEEVTAVLTHLQNLKLEKIDFREEFRRIEQKFLTEYAGFLAGNQAFDFLKQDPITEIVEWAEACQVESRLSDTLFEQEKRGEITIKRDPAFVFCVCNFSNFLDLSRKMIRNMELGVPCVVLSRENTGQHMYRYSELLVNLMQAENVPLGLLTFLSADRAGHTKILKAFSESPGYLTGARGTAVAVKNVLPKLCASTGGPNTMVVSGEMTPSIAGAAALSVGIENSGQCTAMRHLITDQPIDPKEILRFKFVGSPVDSVRDGEFGNLFTDQSFELKEGYTQVDENPVAFRANDALPESINENWRNVYLDVTKTESIDVEKVSAWLNTFQPITLAVNSASTPYELLLNLFEHTALVVYTVGNEMSPAYTCQARPQEGEVFGEFPPRHAFGEHTRFPVIVPSSTPGYNSVMTKEHLAECAGREFPIASGKPLVDLAKDLSIRGYCQLLGEYIQSSCGPQRGTGSRTSLFGLQRPPLGLTNIVRVTDLEQGVCFILPYICTNANESLSVSCANEEIKKALESAGVNKCIIQSDEEFSDESREKVWAITNGNLSEFVPPGHFIGVLFPLGHVKSTLSDDERFIKSFTTSKKWLAVR